MSQRVALVLYRETGGTKEPPIYPYCSSFYIRMAVFKEGRVKGSVGWFIHNSRVVCNFIIVINE